MLSLIRKSFVACLVVGFATSIDRASFAADAGEAGLRAGAARRSIVPPFPTRMAGFFDRHEKFTGVHAPIHARALVCDNGTTRLAVVTVDMIGVTGELVATCRERIEKQTGIPGGNVLISASHTHSGPSGFQRVSHYGHDFDAPLLDFLIKEITQTVVDAHANLAPAQVGFRSGRLDDATRNRQQNNGTVIDPEVGVLKVTQAGSRKVIAVLFNFTGHPVILGERNLRISGEYPGYAETTVEDVLGGVAMFTQGACGDVTVHRSGDPYLEVERLGRVLAGEVIKTAEMIRPTSDARLYSRFQPVEVQPRKLPTPPDAEKQLADAKKAYADAKAAGAPRSAVGRLERDADSAQTTMMMARFAAQKPAVFQEAGHMSVHVVQIAPLVLVGVPGEMFVEYALEMKQRARQTKDRSMMLVGYANDYLGYIVTPRAKHTGGYEQAVSRVDENAGRLLTEAAMQLVDAHVK